MFSVMLLVLIILVGGFICNISKYNNNEYIEFDTTSYISPIEENMSIKIIRDKVTFKDIYSDLIQEEITYEYIYLIDEGDDEAICYSRTIRNN